MSRFPTVACVVLLAACSDDSGRSLILAHVSKSASVPVLGGIRLTAGGASHTYAGDAPHDVGLYLPSSISGTVHVVAQGLVGNAVAASAETDAVVSPGSVTTVTVILQPATVPDAGIDAGTGPEAGGDVGSDSPSDAPLGPPDGAGDLGGLDAPAGAGGVPGTGGGGGTRSDGARNGGTGGGTLAADGASGTGGQVGSGGLVGSGGISTRVDAGGGTTGNDAATTGPLDAAGGIVGTGGIGTGGAGTGGIGTGGSGTGGAGTGGASGTGGTTSCGPQGTAPFKMAQGQAPTEVMVDAQSLYYSDVGKSQIVIAPLDCGTPVPIPDQPAAVSLIQDDAFVYFSVSTDGGIIRRLDKRTRAVTNLATLWQVKALALDASNVYYVRDLPNVGSVGVVAKAGGPATDLFANVDSPRGVVVDAGTIYWTQWNSVRRGSLTGEPAGVISTDEYGPSWLLADATNLYWYGNNTAEIKRAGKQATAADRLVTWPDYQSRGLAIDDIYIYFAHGPAGTVQRLPKNATPGTPPQDIATGQSIPTGVAVDNQYVYWANNGDGRVIRAPK